MKRVLNIHDKFQRYTVTFQLTFDLPGRTSHDCTLRSPVWASTHVHAAATATTDLRKEWPKATIMDIRVTRAKER